MGGHWLFFCDEIGNGISIIVNGKVDLVVAVAASDVI